MDIEFGTRSHQKPFVIALVNFIWAYENLLNTTDEAGKDCANRHQCPNADNTTFVSVAACSRQHVKHC